MMQNVRISHSAVRSYFAADFALGRDFQPTYAGAQLVKTQTINGHLMNTGEDGFPELRDEFLDHMEENDSDFRAPHARMLAIFNGMRRTGAELSRVDEKMNHLHAALDWWAFGRLHHVTQEDWAETKKVTERTVRRWLSQAILYVVRQLRGEQAGALVQFPASSAFQPAAAGC